MSAQNKLDMLKAAFNKKATTTDGDQSWKLFFSFWKAEVGTTSIIRFLPDLDANNPLGFLVEKLEHELFVNGQRKKVPCLSMHGEQCPICDLSRKYYDDKNEEMGKKYYRKKSYVGQILVIESPIEHDQTQLVKLIDFGPKIFKQIQAAFQSGDLEEAPYELKGGYNFRIKKTQDGKYASYDTSNFQPKQSDLEDEVIEQLNLFNLADYRGAKLDAATIEALLIADQTGSTLTLPADDSGAPAKSEASAQKASAPKEEAKESAPKEEAAPSKGGSVLEQLRARAAAAKLAAESAE